jgi:hypothetical protein
MASFIDEHRRHSVGRRAFQQSEEARTTAYDFKDTVYPDQRPIELKRYRCRVVSMYMISTSDSCSIRPSRSGR